jgi:uncharacterized protein with PIN domain
VKFVVDAQLPPLARLLREAGCDAFAVREIGLREASDAEIWRYAVQQQAAIITKAARTNLTVPNLLTQSSVVPDLSGLVLTFGITVTYSVRLREPGV